MALRYQTTIKFSLILFISFCCQFVIAQEESFDDEENTWHKGKVFLNSGDSITGLIKYDFKENKIEYKKGNDYRLLLPGKFTKVTFTSSIDSSIHTFNVFKIETARDYYRPYFFEVIDTTGKIKLIRQYYWIDQVTSFGNSGFFITRKEKIIQLYRLQKNSTVTSYRPRRKKILKSMKDKKNEIIDYAYSKILSFAIAKDVIKIVKYYNSLFNDSINSNI